MTTEELQATLRSAAQRLVDASYESVYPCLDWPEDRYRPYIIACTCCRRRGGSHLPMCPVADVERALREGATL